MNKVSKLENTFVQAVRNSLNLPHLRVSVRHHPSRRSWSFRLHQGRRCSDWLELDSGAITIMKKVGLLPALHLGTFRLAYATVQKESPAQTQSSGQNKKASSASKK